MIETEINVPISPYSIAVAPLLQCKNRLRRVGILFTPLLRYR